MEHWQFLIQKQGARSWHIVESPNLELLEGQYRVLARSNLRNTDVEVRVTHSSTQEVQPTRRIFKRSRRTNSEGLIAVIPFTYFQQGVWELRCCGDLMSDLFGKSWQYSVQLQVLSQEVEEVEEVEGAGGAGEAGGEKKSLPQAYCAQTHYFEENEATSIYVETLDKAIAISPESAIATDSHLVSTELQDEGNLEVTAPAEFALTLNKAIAISPESAIATDSHLVSTELPDEGNLEGTAPAEFAITLDNAIAISPESVIATDSHLVSTELPDEGNLEGTASAEPAITLDNAIAISPESAIATDSHLVSTELPDEGNLEGTAPAEFAITLDKAIAVSPESAIATDSNSVSTELPDEGNLEVTAPAEPAITLDNAIAGSPESAIATDSNPVSTELLDEGNLEVTASAEPAITLDNAIAISTESAIATDSNPVTTELPDEGNLEGTAPAELAITLNKAIVSKTIIITTKKTFATTDLPDETEENVAIDEPVSPVWLKGETAEQILQNLIDLALPPSESLLKDQKVTDSPAIQPPPPLLLTLDRDTYIARWGQALTINGHVELRENTDIDRAETLSSKSLQALELGIELRSPKNSEILTQVWQPLPDQELPFSINTSIDIPADCESKLILADISLYGQFADVGEVIRLASQSFTITADVMELLAITAATKPSTFLNDPIAPSDSSVAFTEPETTFKLDLKLLNLVKVPKTDQSQILNPSPNTPLPPQINLQVLRESSLRASKLKNSVTSPQLPKLPPVQTNANTATDVVAKPPTQEEVLKKDTIAAINLEQLLISQRRMPILDTTFPYLRRLQALPGDAEEVKSNVVPPDVLQVPAPEGFPQLDAAVAEDGNTPELVVGDAQFQEESIAVEAQPNAQFQEESVAVEAQANTQFQEESVAVEAQPNTQFQEESVAVEAQPNAQFITTGNLYSSPLLRKWMESQGYSLPESINDLQRQEYDNYVPTQQTLLSLSAENANVDVNLPLDLDANTEINMSEVWDRSELLLTETHNEEDTWEEVELAFDLGNFEEDVDTAKEADLGIEENTELEKVLEPTLSSALSRQLPPPPPPIKINIASAWLAQEIVVDDTYNELEADATGSYLFEEEEQSLLDLSPSLPIISAATEPLPIPQLHVPEGELIAGKSVIVRVILPEVSPQVVVKLWVEDYQTRWLLDGPHLLANLVPNTLGGLEVMTQLNIPFGCLEIRLEAIALNLITQEESHKVTIVRTVIPPDLPSLQLDELLGM
ncbi:MAG: hypothetical protein V7L01_14495 [Nostoc sp.]|uniref:hypothetical protein n=1 Tax=Nostoc sp. TaxID=1180 RepID=UPI002FF66ABC